MSHLDVLDDAALREELLGLRRGEGPRHVAHEELPPRLPLLRAPLRRRGRGRGLGGLRLRGRRGRDGGGREAEAEAGVAGAARGVEERGEL